MKKSVLFLLTFIMLLCVSVSCFANQPYKHPDYNLRTVKEIHITKIDNLEGEPSRSFKADENAETKVLAAVLQAAGKSAEADRFAATHQKDNPKDAVFLSYLGERAIARKEYGVAEKNYAAVVQLQPNNASAYNNLAWVTSKLNKEGAIAYAEKANALAPNQPAIMDTLAVLLSDKGNYAKAVELQNKALALEPRNVFFKLNLAKIHIKGGKKDLARKELDELSKLGDKLPFQAEVATLLTNL